ncbi:hypothetical protein KUTeg_009258 [Tegillarca granosa]|uniref:DUF1977 domain-containing protein n=1 Tax=Tegillarca granosa TaxID=220873 RepID=A0ABQ9F738_TEGGR|nr:hypothetical protein KUTeg_009258 [Tegillarca granosa]
MDGNKDESERCIRLAQKYLAAGENERALKFLNKAERLYPSQKAKDLIEKLSNINGSSAGQKTDNADDSQNQTHARRRKNTIGNAFAVLSDEGKRRKYDMYGPEQEQTSHREHDYSHGFEGDISPEELFNMFFGGGFPSRKLHTVSAACSNITTSSLVFVKQLFCRKYSSERKTSHLRVLYYVKSDFRIEFKSDLRRIERQVEEDYITSLRQNCWRERNNKENMMWRARNFADAKLYERAQNMETPSCDKLGQIYS